MIGIEPPGNVTPNTLGSWYSDSNIEMATMDESGELIQVTSGNSTKTYKIHEQERTKKQYDIYKQVEMCEITTRKIRVRIARKNDEEIWLLDKHVNTIKRPPMKENCTLHKTEVDATERGERRLLLKIMQNSAVIVTDASDDKQGNLVAAFCEQLTYEEETTEREITGWAYIPTSREDADSYRGELGGIVIAVRYIKNLCERHKLQRGQCMIKLDSESAITSVTPLETGEYPRATEPSFDLLRILQQELKESHIRFKFDWVRGHQDDHNPYEELDDAARANCRADKIAEKRIENAVNLENPMIDYQEGPVLVVADKKLHSKLVQNIVNMINGNELDKYWIHKGRYRAEDKQYIDWIALDKATKKYKFSDQVILSKLLSNTAPTAKIMHRRDKYVDPLCPLCHREMETPHHLVQCPNNEMEQHFDKQLETMKKRLTNSRMDTNMVDKCIKYMKSLRANNNDKVWDEVCHKQGQLGDWALYDGILHTDLHKKCGGTRGAQVIIKEMFNVQLRTWKHRCYLVNNKDKHKKRREKLDKDYEEAIRKIPRIMSPVDNKRYRITKDIFSRMTMDEQERWINAMSNMRQKYMRLAKKGLLRYWSQPTDTQPLRQKKRTLDTEPVRECNQTTTKRRQTTLTTWMKRKRIETPSLAENKRRNSIHTITGQKRTMEGNEPQIRKVMKRTTKEEKITRWINRQRDPGE
jgi:ribonuclease HI